MGLSQLIRTFILSIVDINLPFDIATPIYYLINIPLFILAYKKLGKYFFYRTLYSNKDILFKRKDSVFKGFDRQKKRAASLTKQLF